jgi:hypothetical protein
MAGASSFVENREPIASAPYGSSRPRRVLHPTHVRASESGSCGALRVMTCIDDDRVGGSYCQIRRYGIRARPLILASTRVDVVAGG